MSNMERKRQQRFVMSLDGLIQQRDTVRQFEMQTSRRGWCTKLIAEKEKFENAIFKTNLLFNLSAIKGSVSIKRTCPESSSPSTRQRYMCGLAYQRKVPLKLCCSVGSWQWPGTPTSYQPLLCHFWRSTHMAIVCIDNDPKHATKYIQHFLLQIKYSGGEFSWVPRLKPNRDVVGLNEDPYLRQGQA